MMHNWKVTTLWGEKLISTMRSLRKQEVAILVARDEVSFQLRR
jgi:hypothetical protein